ncbi:AEC family transporter [Thiopseudomonas denitrificans]|uniref:AEC family transporter n=1 Tax=Thiopseudomonas denitrificans TaxID=1501432 RepID=A0A4R6U0A8_9GAMM|nr:AEC family transporter [Thiopseudomonas denitrificans]TDQ38622.1 hypothetical protein DFQ45_104202 [Thiopseudomonas denitrificans]
MLLTLLNIIIPVFAVTGLGYLFARKRSKAPEMDFINSVNVHLFCPMLIFSALLANPVDLASDWALVVAGVAIILLPGLLLWFVRPAAVNSSAFLMTGMFRNTGNMGIPLLMLAYGKEALGDIIVLFVISNTLHFSVGIWLISRSRGAWGWLRNPNVWAAVLGITLAPVREQIPLFIQTTVDMLGQVSIPLMLFSLGVRMASGRISQLGLALRINLLYLVAGLLSVTLILLVLPLSPLWVKMLVVTAALPPAVLNYLLSEQYQADTDTVASVVLLGNLLAVVVMPLVIALTLTW